MTKFERGGVNASFHPGRRSAQGSEKTPKPNLVLERSCANFTAMKSQNALLAAGFLGLTGVALGAFGAHALRAQLTELGTRDRWETAVHYHLIHTVAIFAAAVWLRPGFEAAATRLGWAVRSWILGVFLFSGSLYLLALKAAPSWLGASAAPLGGLSFMIGWGFVVAAGCKKAAPPPR
jgi:uncharacterized membrane protein YgdD (TMEM256/DUF423 family)